MRRLLVATATAGLFALLVAPAALAAPAVVDSSPEDGATEHQAPDSVSITFDMPLDPGASLIKVVDECGRQIDAENTTVQLNEMSVDIAKKPSGLYKAFYHAAAPAGATGTSNGSISFTVHAGPACGPEAKTHDHGGGSGNDGGGHEGHQGGGGHDGGNGHDGHDSDAGGGASDHTTHAGSSTSHTDHTSSMDHSTHAAGGSHEAHGKARVRNAKRARNAGNGSVAAGNGPGPRAAGGDEFALSDGQAILVSLGVCLLLGVAGGWMIRTTQPPRKSA